MVVNKAVDTYCTKYNTRTQTQKHRNKNINTKTCEMTMVVEMAVDQ